MTLLIQENLPAFNYMAPQRLEELLRTLQDKEGAYLLAGGTDLVDSIREKNLRPRYLISMKNLSADLSYVHFNKPSRMLNIGPLTTIHDIETSEIIGTKFPILTHAAEELGSYQVRNKATLGGNLCNASPAADIALPLLAADAKLKLLSINGERSIPIEDFFVGPGKTSLQRGELLKETSVQTHDDAIGDFMKLGRRNAMEISIVSIATQLRMDGNTCKEARIALGSVAPTPMRAKKAESTLTGQQLTTQQIDHAASEAQNEATPITDLRATAYYRSEMIRVLVRRSLQRIKRTAGN